MERLWILFLNEALGKEVTNHDIYLVPISLAGIIKKPSRNFKNPSEPSCLDNEPRTTPGKAIGYFFIPFFNIYWAFFVYPALATDNNSYMNREKIPGPRMSYGLSICFLLSRILFAISLFLLPIIYGINPANFFLFFSKLDTATLVALYLIFLLGQILFFIYVVKVKESILAILAFRKTT
jgi:hypothetical protein